MFVMAVNQCQVHKTHRPRPLRWVEHHIWPLAMGGPDVGANKVKVCDTGHFNMHRLLGILETEDRANPVSGPGELKFTPLDGGTPLERILALRGFDQWVAAGRPGKRVFEEHAKEAQVWGLTGGSDGRE